MWNFNSRLVKNWISNNALLIIFSLCIISRLPQLLSPNLFLDGDECIVGLMAKHFTEGRELPFFFYGQTYGFSFIEVLFISIFYLVLGVSDIAIKLAMLLLWTLGIVFFYKTLKEIGPKDNQWAALLVTILFIFFPAWAIWSMKARGGYLTAFALTSFVTYLLFNNKGNKPMHVVLIGFCVVVIYQSQPLWLAGLIPIIVYQMYKLERIRLILQLCAGTAIGILAFSFLKGGISTYWSPTTPSFSNFSFSSFERIPNQIYENFTGSYYYSAFVEPNLITQAMAGVSTSFIALSLPLGIYFYLRGKKASRLSYVFCLSVLGTIGYLLLFSGNIPRYLLPLSGFLMLMLYQVMLESRYKVLINSLVYSAIVLSSFVVYSFKDHEFDRSKKSKLLALIDELEERDFDHIYVNEGLLQWQIMFYSNERTIGRYRNSTDRYPPYIKQVDDALDNGSPGVAMVGFISPNDPPLSSHVIPIEGLYYIYGSPDESALREYGFRFKKDEINN